MKFPIEFGTWNACTDVKAILITCSFYLVRGKSSKKHLNGCNLPHAVAPGSTNVQAASATVPRNASIREGIHVVSTFSEWGVPYPYSLFSTTVMVTSALLQSNGKHADRFIKAIPTWPTSAHLKARRVQNNMEAAVVLFD